MTARRPAVFSIAPGTPFVDALAAGILDAHGGGPLGLSHITVLLPTRRARRALREAFLRVGEGAPMLLPVMRPLGDMDEEELGLLGEAFEGVAGASGILDLPPAIAPLRRQLLLTRAILARGDGAGDPSQAAMLAAELAAFLDQVQTERLSFDALADLVPEDYAAHWQVTLRFLHILTEAWPGILTEQGGIDPAERRNRLIRAQAEQWRQAPPCDPVIAAGSTGSIPATAELLGVVAGLPAGAVVLPGLDGAMDDATWDAVEATHPQFGMKQLLAAIGVPRQEVLPWPSRLAPRMPDERGRLVAEAMRPAPTTEVWADLPPPSPEALEGIALAVAPGLREEAGIVALTMREALETPGRSAALVTPDRQLARRVAAELRRWGVEVDDSAGVTLGLTPPGAFLRLTAEMIGSDLAPVTLLAALKHPLASGGEVASVFRRRTRRLEELALRGPRPAPGFEGLAAALVEEVGDAPGIGGWLNQLAQAAAPYSALMKQKQVPLLDLLLAHVAFTEWLATPPASDETGLQGCPLWVGEAGEAAARFVDELREACVILGPIDPTAYAALMSTLMSGQVVRPRYGRHGRLSIWGPLEARLQSPDLLILGGLNEGSWPAEPATDPWLSRPMRARFGLPAPERRIGLAAHDFVQAASARNVLLTRATKTEGTPTVPSRWLARLQALLQTHGLGLPEGVGDTLAHWHDRLDAPSGGVVKPVSRPEPRPPLQARPRRLSVTQVETWMRDPYGIYARHILGLKALDDIDADPAAADRGNFIHQALDRFVKTHMSVLPDDAYEQLLEQGHAAFGEALAYPGVRAFWWPRFQRIAAWFLEQERGRRAAISTLSTEVEACMAFPGRVKPFTLVAKADRIDRGEDGRLHILDYKTGAPPEKRDLVSGYAPQLPLEAAMAEAGAFEGLAAAEVGLLSVWRLRGGEPAGEIRDMGVDPAEVAATARQGLEGLIAAFDDVDTPYHARPKPEVAPRFSDYEHLARLKEWSAGGGEEP